MRLYTRWYEKAISGEHSAASRAAYRERKREKERETLSAQHPQLSYAANVIGGSGGRET